MKSLIHTVEKPEKLIFIYGLCDPDTNELKYIGLSTVGFKRLQNHYNCCYQFSKKRGNYKLYSNIKRWVKELKDKKKIFKVIYLEYFDNDGPHVDEAEMFWIAYFKMLGANLLNHDNGGRTEYLKYHNDEYKLKASRIAKKNNNKPEMLEFFKKHTTDTWKNPEIRKRRLAGMRSGKKRNKQQIQNMIQGNSQRFTIKDDLGNIYPSLNETARQLGVGAMVVHRALKNGKKVKGRTLFKVEKVP